MKTRPASPQSRYSFATVTRPHTGGFAANRLTRRSFLKQAAFASVAAAAPLIVPGRVLGLEGRVAPSNRITIGLIGTGRQAIYANLPGFLREPDAQAVAVCDVDSWRMEQARQQVETHYARQSQSGSFKGCAAFRDFREVLAHPDIEAVMISTPDHWHVPMAMAAIQAGKDVACEKPLTRNIAEGRKLADLVARKAKVFRTDSEFRSNRTFHRAAEMVRNGKIGALQRIISSTPRDSTLAAQPEMPVPAELDFDLWLGPAPLAPYTEQRVHPRRDAKGRPGWLCIRDYADGMLANWGAHLNDIALWANDSDRTGPVEIEGTGKYPPAGNLWDIIQEFTVHFTFANGVRLTCQTDKPYLRFEGTEGWIHVTYPNGIETQPESLLGWKPGANDLHLPFKPSEKRDFLDAVKSRGPTQGDAEVGHRNTSLSHLALVAIDLGRKLKWDPHAEMVIGDAEANHRLQPKPMRAPWSI
ncbi:MAG: Gfo/Idh/MocA family oxidoreductase [Verrucomicrobiae bacterium]|nr:Gfo/Idh/MocA family oxidoreductase [Verrucomicrobiae bacterium]